MNTLILALLLLVGSIVGSIWCDRKDHDEFTGFFVAVLLIVIFFMIIWVPTLVFTPQHEISVFERQKAHIETLAPDELENAGAVIVKAEQNTWLFGAQYVRERFGNWGIYPASVLELEPIE